MENYYERNDTVLEAGKFRMRSDTIEIFPAYDENCIRVTFFDDEIERVKSTAFLKEVISA